MAKKTVGVKSIVFCDKFEQINISGCGIAFTFFYFVYYDQYHNWLKTFHKIKLSNHGRF